MIARIQTRKCALPGCNNVVHNGTTCCKGHGQQLRRLAEKEIADARRRVEMANSICGHPRRMVNAVVAACETLKGRGKKVDRWNVFGALLHMSDDTGIEFYDGDIGGYESPDEVEEVLQVLRTRGTICERKA